jgi:hypothetical protein
MLDPAAVDVAAVMAALFFLIAGWNQVQKFLDRQKDKPAPGEVRAEAAASFVRREDCARTHAAYESQLAEVRKNRIEDAKDGANSRRAIYEQINLVRTDMTSMERRLNAENEARLNKVHGRVDDVLTAVSRVEGKLEAAAEARKGK